MNQDLHRVESECRTDEGRKCTVSVPLGATPGDKITVELQGATFTTTVPKGAVPGDTFEMALPDREDMPGSRGGITLTVPEGGRPGDQMKVEHLGRTFFTTIPPNLRPGQHFQCALSPADDGPHAEVPADKRAGDSMSVTYNGEDFTVKIPAGAKPGDHFALRVPKGHSAQPDNTRKVLIPQGASEGDKLNMQVDGHKFTFTVPKGTAPGDSVLVNLPDQVAEGQEKSACTESARAPAPVRHPEPVAVTVSRIEESLGENADGAIKGLVARVQHLEQVLLGEVQTGSLAGRVAVLQSNC